MQRVEFRSQHFTVTSIMAWRKKFDILLAYYETVESFPTSYGMESFKHDEKSFLSREADDYRRWFILWIALLVYRRAMVKKKVIVIITRSQYKN